MPVELQLEGTNLTEAKHARMEKALSAPSGEFHAKKHSAIGAHPLGVPLCVLYVFPSANSVSPSVFNK